MAFASASSFRKLCLGVSRHGLSTSATAWQPWSSGMVAPFVNSPMREERRSDWVGSAQQSSFSTTAEDTPNVEKLLIPDEPFPQSGKSIADMTNEELQDTSTIPGFDTLIHSPPRNFPRGALVGTVVSDKMQKTINVAVVRHRIVPKIRKRLKYTRKFMAHDESEVARMGDVVMITPCHKITKNKHFMLREIIRPKGQLY